MATGDVEGVEEDLGAGEISGGEEGGAVWTTEGATGAAEGGSNRHHAARLTGADTPTIFRGKVTTIV